jgi:carbon-monoxide dehydrogenase large subunit
MPRAADVPSFALADHGVPTKTNPLGVKGCGEAGCAGGLPCAMNAVLDALAEHGVRHVNMPLTPFRSGRRCRRQNRPIRNDATHFGSHDIVG